MTDTVELKTEKEVDEKQCNDHVPFKRNHPKKLRFDLLEEVGQGTYGLVHRCQAICSWGPQSNCFHKQGEPGNVLHSNVNNGEGGGWDLFF